MRAHRFSARQKVGALVVVFVVALSGVAAVAATAVADQTRTANRMYTEGQQLALANALVDDLHDVGESGQLDATSIASIDNLLRDLGPVAASDGQEVPALVARMGVAWDRAVSRSQHADSSGADEARRSVLGDAHLIVEHETADRLAAYHRLSRSQDEERRQVLLALAVAVATVLATAIATFRSILRRVREYASFAVSVTSGANPDPIHLRGNDELTDLGSTLNLLVTDQRSARAYDESQAEFLTTLQLAETEDEAHHLVKRHLERSLESAQATVLNRNNSADRLEATTELDESSPLRAALADAGPRSCLAVRFARANERGCGDDPLVDCSVCSASDRPTRCQPLLVGGEVIGSVLVEHDTVLDDEGRRRVRDTVTQSSPVLANLRNLAVAEFRANNDSLTGVANRRAADDTLKRLAAIASRTVTPLAAILLDLDHFKQLNDVYGHDKGDEVLAAAGHAMRSALRDSDFVGRFGGEEFIVLLPDTDVDGGVAVAENLRMALRSVHVPNVDRAITASFGVAVIPDHAGEPATLVRHADRALYAAKAGGRDRVEVAALDRATAGAPDVLG